VPTASGRPNEGRLISFDEAGFTGPDLLNEQQPYFVYASHDLTEIESEGLIRGLRERHGIQGDELKATKLKRRNYWPSLTEQLCAATDGRAKVVTHEKKVALAGKFVEYFFEPVLADNSMLFYRINFQRYLANTLASLFKSGASDFDAMVLQMQQFMRSFDPEVAPDVLGGPGRHPIELERVLQFCQGYSRVIAEETKSNRPEFSNVGKWTLDLTSTSLFSLLFLFWGHRHPQLRILCDESKPLMAVDEFFNTWVGEDNTRNITDGRRTYDVKGNLVAPVQFGSSSADPSLQIADLLAGLTLDVCMRKDTAPRHSQAWVKQHILDASSVEFLPEFVRPGNPTVRIGREVLKELARRAKGGAAPLNGMDEFVARLERQFHR
jgi:hypothetical protein